MGGELDSCHCRQNESLTSQSYSEMEVSSRVLGPCEASGPTPSAAEEGAGGGAHFRLDLFGELPFAFVGESTPT